MKSKGSSKHQKFIRGIYYGDIDKVKKYIDKDNINLPLPDSPNVYPIHAAFESYNPAIVKYFLDLGAKLDIKGINIFSSNSTVEYMVQQAIDRYYQGDEIDVDIEIIKLLYDYGANLNIKNDNNETPLEMAMKIPYKRLERFLRSISAKTSEEINNANKNSV